MSDLGSEMSGQVLNMTKDLFENFFNLIGKLFSTLYDQSLGKSAQDRNAAKHVLEEYEFQKKQRKLSGKAGHADHAKLKKAGVPLEYTGLENVTKEQYRNIKKACAKHDLLCSSISNSDGTYIVMCKREERDLFLKIVNNEILQNKLSAIDKAIENIENDSSISKEEKDKAVEELKNQRGELVSKHNDTINNEQWGKTAESILKNEKDFGCSKSFNNAILWNTDNLANVRNEAFFIVDALDPNKYVECKPYIYADVKGTEKVGTNYTVHGSKEGHTLTVTDKNYEAIPAKEWFPKHLYPMLDKMKTHAGFSNSVFKLQTKDEFDKFKELHDNALIDKELRDLGFDSLQPDIAAKYLEAQLISNGYELSNSGYVINSDSRERVSVVDANDFDNFTVTKDNHKDVEALIIGNQINAYQAHHAALKNADQLKGNDGAYNALLRELNDAEARYKMERQFIASKTAEFETRNHADVKVKDNLQSHGPQQGTANRIDEKSLFTKKDVMSNVNRNEAIKNLIKEVKARSGMASHARPEIGGIAR
ncbi:MAG: hypothetical protein FWC20_04450 [Oscillospiraceae bacterium]|nr:hypothetical protein [Oscillospiraceae bacterium]MCL2278643.1 hypothetical protein [Oscillospiraceae bacterium]